MCKLFHWKIYCISFLYLERVLCIIFHPLLLRIWQFPYSHNEEACLWCFSLFFPKSMPGIACPFDKPGRISHPITGRCPSPVNPLNTNCTTSIALGKSPLLTNSWCEIPNWKDSFPPKKLRKRSKNYKGRPKLQFTPRVVSSTFGKN